MIKNFDKRLDEITDQHADIQKKLSDINLSQEKRIKLSKKFWDLFWGLNLREFSRVIMKIIVHKIFELLFYV